MNDKIKKMFKYLILFIIGGIIYYFIEVIFRGWSHWAMILVGGFCFVMIGELNEHFTFEMPLLKQGVIGACIVTAIEFISGLILNVYLGMNIWDYSALPYDLLGQICLPFSILWIFVSALAVIVDDWLRYFLFKEEKPHYILV